MTFVPNATDLTVYDTSVGTMFVEEEPVDFSPTHGPVAPDEPDADFPKELIDLCSFQVGMDRMEQAQKIMEYHLELVKTYNYLWRMLVYSMGYVEKSLLYIQIGIVAQGTPFNNIGEYWEYLKVDRAMALSAIRTFQIAGNYLKRIGMPLKTIETPAEGQILVEMAIDTDRELKQRKEELSKDEIEEHRAAVMTVKETQMRPIGPDMFRRRHEDIKPKIAVLPVTIEEYGEDGQLLDEPVLVIHRAVLTFAQVQAASCNLCKLVPQIKGVQTSWSDATNAMTAAAQARVPRREIETF